MVNLMKKSKPQIKLEHGFTLVEVLVASVILFSTIAVVSMVYRGAFISSEKATSHIAITGVLPSVLANIKQSIRAKGNSPSTELSGNSNAWDVSYQWRASLVSFKSPPDRFEEGSNVLVTPPEKYKLWQVELAIEKSGLVKSYQFKELSWNDN